jgi:hypothetical protein
MDERERLFSSSAPPDCEGPDHQLTKRAPSAESLRRAPKRPERGALCKLKHTPGKP